MNWIGRKIHLYNVTIGLYMLDCRGVALASRPCVQRRGKERRRVRWRLGAGPAMLEVVISIPAIFLVILLALGCYMLGRNRGRAEAQQQFAPPAPPPGLSPK
nr:unnamed protein product [Digitaria exilis]